MKLFMNHTDKVAALYLVEKDIIRRNRFRRGGKVIDLAPPIFPSHSH
jgi:hypothetical protein